MVQRLSAAGSTGELAIGPAYQYRPHLHINADPANEALAAALDRLIRAQSLVAMRMQALAEREREAGREETATLFEFLSFLAEDPILQEDVEQHLANGLPLSRAIEETIVHMARGLATLDDPYQRERAEDVLALGRDLLAALHQATPTRPNPPAGSIFIAEHLSPADLAELPTHLAGVVVVSGSPTGHTTILARARGLTALVGIDPQVLEIATGTEIVLHSNSKSLLIAPSATERAQIIKQVADQQIHPVRILPIFQPNGQRLPMLANIGGPSEVANALAYGAEGVGLFRSEVLFFSQAHIPTEAEQYQAYTETLQALGERPLIVRVLDLGADKPLPSLHLSPEPNPALGNRGIRLLRQYPDLLIPQLRALLRAAVHGNLQIMLPMVATPDDLLWGREQLRLVAETLQREGLSYRTPPLGAMIETPAAAVTIDLLAPLADFFSIGSNDLAQYALAVDREATSLTNHYPAHTPAVLRMIEIAAQAAQQYQRPIGLCGELASQPIYAAACIHAGVNSLSMQAEDIPTVREALATMVPTNQACSSDTH
ncbi:MAG: phosphoenolpyruvate--protein phosphotransferase [Roseiflexaceae bacterium]